MDLAERWQHGQRTVHGTKTAAFPNFHIVGTYAQASQSFTYSHVTSCQTAHAAKIVARCLAEGVRSFEVTEDAEDKWLQALANNARDMSQFQAECTPGYFNNEGKKGQPTLLGNMFGGGPFEYVKILDQWLEESFEADTRRT